MFAVHELGFLATRVDVAICANVVDFCVQRQPTTTYSREKASPLSNTGTSHGIGLAAHAYEVAKDNSWQVH